MAVYSETLSGKFHTIHFLMGSIGFGWVGVGWNGAGLKRCQVLGVRFDFGFGFGWLKVV